MSNLFFFSANKAINIKMNEKYDIIISGMGLAGLALAYSTANRGFQICLLDKRTSFLRVQKIFLNSASRNFLRSCINKDLPIDDKDQKFLRELIQPFVALKDIQGFLHRRLQKFKNVTLKFNTELEEVDLKQGSAQLINNHTRKTSNATFFCLVGADGSEKHALKTLNKNPKNKKITITKEEYGLYPFHVSANYLIKKRDGAELMLPRNIIFSNSIDQNNYLTYLSFDELSYQKHQRMQFKCAILGELPKSIYNNPKVEERTKQTFEYTQSVITKELMDQEIIDSPDEVVIEIKHSKKIGKDQLKQLVFETSLEQASAAAIEQNQHYFILMGDAFRSSLYQLAEGGNNALLHAKHVDWWLENDSFSIRQYNNFCMNLAHNSAELLRKYGPEVYTTALEHIRETLAEQQKYKDPLEYANRLFFSPVLESYTPENPSCFVNSITTLS